jgi:hypothetical protein
MRKRDEHIYNSFLLTLIFHADVSHTHTGRRVNRAVHKASFRLGRRRSHHLSKQTMTTMAAAAIPTTMTTNIIPTAARPTMFINGQRGDATVGAIRQLPWPSRGRLFVTCSFRHRMCSSIRTAR